tara:strand:- start:2554 stop:3474 length:921 start_codon:yes stop_codon:yes gene_type:complete
MALNIIFMGTPNFAVPILKKLKESQHNIVAVYTQPPKKKNRGQKINFTPIHIFSNQNKIKIRSPDKLDSEEEFQLIKKLNPDVVIVVAYGKMIPIKFLNIKNIKFINIHASLLPKWRGAAPIQRAIMNQDNETGISLMKITSELDAGPVMMKSKINISKKTNFEELSEKLSNLGAEIILKGLDLIEKDKANFVKQNDQEATYAKKINKIEGKINWTDQADKVIAKINALNPNPGSWFNYSGTRLKIIKAKEITANDEPGKIINSNFTISCSKNAIQILKLQKEGKKIMSVEDYLKGNNIKVGSNVS